MGCKVREESRIAFFLPFFFFLRFEKLGRDNDIMS